mgnify:CR=1 FL=1
MYQTGNIFFENSSIWETKGSTTLTHYRKKKDQHLKITRIMIKPIHKNIEQILPHRPPMLMIDGYTRIDSDNASSEMHFEPSNYGCENGYVLDSMLIECVAQTVAAHFGYKSLGKDEGYPELGMLTSVDTFVFNDMVKDTSKIDIRISKTDEIGAFKLIYGEISVQGKLVAKGRIKVFNPGEMVNN